MKQNGHVMVLPALNEAPALRLLLARVHRLKGTVPALADLHVIVVDDGSSDGTAAVAGTFPGTQVIRHPQNRGLASALKTGLSAAIGHVGPGCAVFVMDADDTHDPAAIPLMLEALEAGTDVVIGSRFAAGGRERGIPWHRKVFARGAAALMRITCGLAGVRDYTCGFRAYRPTVVRDVLSQDWVFDSRGFSVTVSLLLAAAKANSRIAEIPITVHYDRKPGKSAMRTIPTILGTFEAARTYRLQRRSVAS